MKFEEALSHINIGCKMRCVNWRDNFYIENVHRDDEFYVSNLKLEDILSDWQHFHDKSDTELHANISFSDALKFHDVGYKIRRPGWPSGLHIKDSVMLDQGDIVYDRGEDMFDFEDVLTNDWIVLK